MTDADTDIVLSFTEAVKKDGSNNDFANADLAGILTLTTTDASGTALPFTATIDTAKTAITIDPDASLDDGVVYVAISDRYYDAAGNQGAMASATFTVDTTAPSVSSAALDGTALTIAFDENLAAAANLANSAFTVEKTPASGSEQTVTLSGSPSISGAEVTLTLASAAAQDDTNVKVSYAKPASGSDNKLRDAAGNEVADFDDQAVTVAAPGICDRTQAVQDALLAAIDGVNACADVTATHLATVTTLDISGAGLTALKRGISTA